LISNQIVEGDRPCWVFDVVRLRETGALALNLDKDGNLTVTSAAAVQGRRPWTPAVAVQDVPVLLAQDQ